MLVEPLPPGLWKQAIKRPLPALGSALVDLGGMALMALQTYGPFYEDWGQTGLFSIRPYLTASPADLFPKPPAAKMKDLFVRERSRHFVEYEGWFESPYEPYSPDYAPYFFALPENRRVGVKVFEPVGREAQISILFLHGFAMGSMEELKVLQITDLALDLPVRMVVMEFPFHMGRKPPQSQFSGEFFMSADLPRSIESCAQAVCDIRALLKWMKKTTSVNGLLGGSLGGFGSSLTITQSRLPDFAIIMMPPSSLGDLVNNPMMGHIARKALAQGGYTEEDVLSLSHKFGPLSFPSLLPPERILMISGLADQFITPKHPLKLWRHFGEPELLWHAGGHTAILFPQHRAWLRKKILAFAQSRGLLAS